MGFKTIFKNNAWNETQAKNKDLIKKNGLSNTLGINFDFTKYYTDKGINLLKDELTQEFIDEYFAQKESEIKLTGIDKDIDKILRTGKANIKVPDKVDAIGSAAIGAFALGKTGAMIGAMGGGATTWNSTKLLITDIGLTIKKTGQGITFDEITEVNLAENIINLTSKYGNHMFFKADKPTPLKQIIDERVPKENTSQSNNVDDLMKYAELYEKGLLTKEEFEAKKKELL